MKVQKSFAIPYQGLWRQIFILSYLLKKGFVKLFCQVSSTNGQFSLIRLLESYYQLKPF
jgi:hypothetical protein